MYRIGGEQSTPKIVASHYGKSAVRTSLLHFLFGKALNALVSLLTLVALARWLAPADYGVYIAFIALQASLLAISSLGIDTTAERFMPELRMHHSDSELLGFVAAVLCARVVTLLVLLGTGWLLAKQVTSLVGLSSYVEVFKIWLCVVAFTGVLAFAVVLLEAMLHQRHAQYSMSAYVVLKLVLLGMGHQLASVDLWLLIQIELIATGVAALLGLGLLLSRFSAKGFLSGWIVVRKYRARMQRFAFFNYVAQVVFQLFNAEIMKLLVTRLLGVLQSAVYGFAYSLADTVQRYLPATLLLRLIKPVFISRYVKTGNFEELNAMARIILKLNLFVLTPTIALAAVYGGELLSLLSDGKYSNAHWLLVSILGLQILTSHQLVLSLLSGTLEKNAMQLYAGMASTIAFPCALLLVPLWGPLGAVAACAISGLTYNVFASAYLRSAGYPYSPDWRGGIVFLAAGSVAYIVSLVLGSAMAAVTPFLAATTTIFLSAVFYLTTVRVFSAFTVSERNMLNTLLPRKIFIF